MVKSVNHQGLRDWLAQRVSAIVMAVYSLGILFYLLMHPNLSFIDWHALFASTAMKIATILFILSLLWHAWVGIWTVLTDYIKPYVLNIVLQILVIFTLAGCFFWALQILWGV